MSVVSRIRRLAMFPVLLLSASIPSLAVSMNVTAGFSDTTKASRWMPVMVTMTNDSSEDIEGTLIATQVEPSKNTPVCAAPVMLPANSKKLYHVYTKMSGYGGSIEARFAASKGANYSKKVHVNAATENDRLIVSVGSRASALSFLSGEKIPVAVQPDPYNRGPIYAEGAIFPTSVTPDALPDRPAGYECADMLVFSGFDPSSVKPAVLKSIGMWVASGGTLVVSTGADYQRYANDFYNDLLPVRVSGATSVSSLASLGSLGGAAFPEGVTIVAMSVVKPSIGKVLASESGVPIVVERNYGSGKVVFLALDHLSQPFSSWNGQTEFWMNLIKSSSSGPLVQTARGFVEDNSGRYGSVDNRLQPAMSGVVTPNATVKTPTVSTIGIFLIAYLIALVPINYAVLKRRGKLEMAWITTPIIVIAFTLGAYAIGYTMKGGRLQLREVTLIEGSSNSRYARAVSDASLFSPARRSYNIEVNDPFSLGQAIPEGDRDAIPTAFVTDVTSINEVPMSMWSSRVFESVSGVDLGGEIKADLTLSGDHVRGTITNATSMPLTGCMVICGSASASVGNLDPGKSVSVDITLGQATPAINPGNYGGSTFSNDLARCLLLDTQKLAGSTGAPILIARGTTHGVFLMRGQSYDCESSEIYALRLDYKVGGPFTIDPGMITASIEKSENIEQNYYSGNIALHKGLQASTIQPGGYVIASYQIDVPAGGKITAINPGLTTNQSQSTVETSIYNRKTGKWDIVDCTTGARVTDVSSYVSPSGEVRIKTALKSGAGTTNAGVKLSAEGKQR